MFREPGYRNGMALLDYRLLLPTPEVDLAWYEIRSASAGWRSDSWQTLGLAKFVCVFRAMVRSGRNSALLAKPGPLSQSSK
jgi:hypothetical protein